MVHSKHKLKTCRCKLSKQGGFCCWVIVCSCIVPMRLPQVWPVLLHSALSLQAQQTRCCWVINNMPLHCPYMLATDLARECCVVQYCLEHAFRILKTYVGHVVICPKIGFELPYTVHSKHKSKNCPCKLSKQGAFCCHSLPIRLSQYACHRSGMDYYTVHSKPEQLHSCRGILLAKPRRKLRPFSSHILLQIARCSLSIEISSS